MNNSRLFKGMLSELVLELTKFLTYSSSKHSFDSRSRIKIEHRATHLWEHSLTFFNLSASHQTRMSAI